MSEAFVRELLDTHADLLRGMGEEAELAEASALAGTGGALESESGAGAGMAQLLRVALVNEISASELAAVWMPSTHEVDVKLALARQAGDEAGHFQLLESRSRALGISMAGFEAPPPNALFDYLRRLETTAERVAAGQVALESIAYRVNESFVRLCERQGDTETARLYRDIIQPEELRHHRTGCELLALYATTPEDRARARHASLRTLEIAFELRRQAAVKLGTHCFPGC